MGMTDLELMMEAFPETNEPIESEATKQEEQKSEGEQATTEESGNLKDESSEEQKEEESAEKQEEGQESTTSTFEPDKDLLEYFKEENKTFTTPEEFNGHIVAKTKEMKERLTEQDNILSKLNEISSNNPEIATILRVLGENKNIVEAIVESGLAELIPQPGDFDHDEFEKQIQARKEANKVHLRTQAELQKNIESSFNGLQSFAKDNGLNEDFTNSVIEFAGELASGRLPNKYLTVLKKGLAYDQKVNELTELNKKEREAGLVQGRNEKIIKQKEVKGNEVNVPDMTSKNTKKEAPIKDNFFSSEFSELVSRHRSI